MDSSFPLTVWLVGLVGVVGLAVGYRRYRSGAEPPEKWKPVARVLAVLVCIGTATVGFTSLSRSSTTGDPLDVLTLILNLLVFAIFARMAVRGP